MCQFASSDSPGFRLNQIGHMKPHVFRKLMDETPGKPLVAFAGGEPLLHPQINEFITHAHAKGCPTWLTTNGWFLAKWAKALCNAGLDFLVVSVDGPPEIHDRIRGRKAFERLAEGLEALLRLPKRPLVFINMAISELNSDQLVNMYDLSVKLGVDGIDYNHLWMQTDEMVREFNAQFASFFHADEVAWKIHPEDINVQQIREAFISIERQSIRNRLIVMQNPLLRQAEIEPWYRQPAHFVKWKTTRCAWNRMRVWPDGGVKGCRGWVVGNITQEHVMDAWNGPLYRSFRRLLVNHGAISLCKRSCDMAHR
jgi:MoaA/NifB/PqqE/SkfB family radical SAM enzyme